MLFAKLLLSPMPHARQEHGPKRGPGDGRVKAILTADDLPASENPGSTSVLSNEPLYQVSPSSPSRRWDEPTAALAIEKIADLEPLPS
jgi:hypothetical protein